MIDKHFDRVNSESLQGHEQVTGVSGLALLRIVFGTAKKISGRAFLEEGTASAEALRWN